LNRKRQGKMITWLRLVVMVSETNGQNRTAIASGVGFLLKYSITNTAAKLTAKQGGLS
jgi:hypothetical protein